MDIQQPEKYKVLLIGDSCEDIYIYGIVNRISPEAPVPILKTTSIEKKRGMAGNVHENLIAFGFDVQFFTNTEPITKTRFIDDNFHHHLLRVDCETNLPAFDEQLDTYYDAIVISDYDKGYVTYDLIEELLETYDCPVFIDTKKKDLKHFDHQKCFIKINRLEKGLLESCGDNIIVTLGPEGALYKNKIYTTEKVDVFDVCGAGDTFLAALVYGYFKLGSIETAINYANKAASITVQHSGVYTLTKEEIEMCL